MTAPDQTTAFALLLTLCTTPCPIHSEQCMWLCSSGSGFLHSALLSAALERAVPALRESTTVVRCTCMRSGHRCAPLRSGSGRKCVREPLETDRLDALDAESEMNDAAGGRYSANGASAISSARSDTRNGIGSCALHT